LPAARRSPAQFSGVFFFAISPFVASAMSAAVLVIFVFGDSNLYQFFRCLGAEYVLILSKIIKLVYTW
jgi:hypothetical protein